MVTRTYDGINDDEPIATDREVERRGYSDVGGQIFLWIAWVLAFAFWVFSMQTAIGILRAIADTPAKVMGGVDLGGIEVFLFSGAGVLILAIAIAYGYTRWATRDRSLDPITEAATAKLYDEGGRPLA